jgi:cytoskeletal protein CcmA (bactofilin family)
MNTNKHKTVGLMGLMAVLLVVVLWMVPTTHASEVRSGDTLIIEAGETINDDVYALAQTVIVNGTIEGDLIAFATDVTINGRVTGDLLGAGQSVVINGTVEDDVRMAGAVLQLGANGQVGDEVMSAGYSLDMQSGSQVGGDLTFLGGQATIDGTIGGDLMVNAGSLAFNGTVAGDANVAVGGAETQPAINPLQFMPDAPDMPTVAPGLTVGDNAKVGGEVNIEVPDRAIAADVPAELNPNVEVSAAPVATTNDSNLFVDSGMKFIGRFLVFAIAAIFVVWLASILLQEATGFLSEKPLPSLGWGALLYFVLPIFAVVIFGAASIVALILGLIGLGSIATTIIVFTVMILAAALLAFIVILALLTKIVAGYALGKLIFRSRPDTNFWVVMLVGLAIVALLIALPIAGGLLNLLISMMGLGALWLTYRGSRAAKADVVKGAVVQEG